MARTPPKLQYFQFQTPSEHHYLQPAIVQPPPTSPLKVQQAQQWVQQEGLEGSIIDLVAYVDAVSASKAKQAAQHEELLLGMQQQQQASLQEQQLLHHRLHEQSQQLQKQARELGRLQHLQPTGDSHYKHLYRELEVQGRVCVCMKTSITRVPPVPCCVRRIRHVAVYHVINWHIYTRSTRRVADLHVMLAVGVWFLRTTNATCRMHACLLTGTGQLAQQIPSRAESSGHCGNRPEGNIR